MKEENCKPRHCQHYYENRSYNVAYELEEKINLYPEKKTLKRGEQKESCKCLKALAFVHCFKHNTDYREIQIVCFCGINLFQILL